MQFDKCRRHKLSYSWQLLFFCTVEEVSCEGLTSYTAPSMEAKSIVICGCLGTYCLQGRRWEVEEKVTVWWNMPVELMCELPIPSKFKCSHARMKSCKDKMIPPDCREGFQTSAYQNWQLHIILCFSFTVWWNRLVFIIFSSQCMSIQIYLVSEACMLTLYAGNHIEQCRNKSRLGSLTQTTYVRIDY